MSLDLWWIISLPAQALGRWTSKLLDKILARLLVTVEAARQRFVGLLEKILVQLLAALLAPVYAFRHWLDELFRQLLARLLAPVHALQGWHQAQLDAIRATEARIRQYFYVIAIAILIGTGIAAIVERWSIYRQERQSRVRGPDKPRQGSDERPQSLDQQTTNDKSLPASKPSAPVARQAIQQKESQKADEATHSIPSNQPVIGQSTRYSMYGMYGGHYLNASEPVSRSSH